MSSLNFSEPLQEGPLMVGLAYCVEEPAEEPSHAVAPKL